MGALSGLLVIAVEQAVAAPLCTARLADAGARVIKIERIGGDFARGYDVAALGDSSYFAWINHQKESVELDFKLAEDAALLHRLIAAADVFVQNLSPGALDRAGFTGSVLRHQNPQLITCDISGYGSGDAVAGLKAYDMLVQAESGLISVSGVPETMGRIGVSVCDIGAGITAHSGILEALIKRGATGAGSAISISLFDVAAEWMSVPLIHAETGQGAPQRQGLQHPSIAPYGAYPSSDATLTLISVQNEREWHRLCGDVLRLPELLDDPRFTSNNARVKNRDVVDKLIADATCLRTATDLRSDLLAASIAYGALNSVAELARHPALRRRTLTNSLQQELSLPAHPVQQSTLPVDQKCTVPALGQHTVAIRQEFS